MWSALPLLGLAAQVPLRHSAHPATTMQRQEFSWKEGPDIFSPLDLVQLVRPGTGTANEPGDLVLVPASKYSVQKKENRNSIFIAPIESEGTPLQIALATGGEAFWLDARTLAHVVPEADGKGQELHAISIKFESTNLSTPDPPTFIGAFPPAAGATNFRFSSASGHLVFSSYVYPDGDLRNVKGQDDAWAKRGTTGLVYDSTYVRHWDTWRGQKESTLFSVELYKDSDGKWHLGEDFVNVLKGSGHLVPVEPFGGTDNFDVSETHIVYTTKDPQLPLAWHTKQNVYIVDIKGKNEPLELTSGEQGATGSPVFNPSGDKVAWVEMDEDGYEADRAKVTIYDLKQDVRFRITQNWDRSASSVTFSHDGEFVYFIAADNARVKIFTLPVPETPAESTNDPSLPLSPLALTTVHSASSVQALPNSRLLFTSSSFTSPNDMFVLRNLGGRMFTSLESAAPLELHQITHFTEADLGDKNLDKGEDFWFEGAEGKTVHGWAIKPKGFKAGEKKKWPVVLLIHGGPQDAWEDAWSNRWNPNIWANQGYFILMINPTGSTSFGQEFTDAITEDWGGKPFVDLRKGWQFALEKWPEIDADRAVGAGASWGGYAINWIQGHPEYGFGFKALVCHDGVFDSNYNGYSTEELYFFNHEWGGRPWDKRTKVLSALFSPSNFVHKWSTPQLLIHGSKDYRLPETESIGAFNALQQLGIPSRLVIFPDENHWVLGHENSLKWNYEVFRWLDEYVGEKK